MKNHEVQDKTGKKNIARNGMEMTIIAYRKYTDIDILFQDETIVYNQFYQDF